MTAYLPSLAPAVLREIQKEIEAGQMSARDIELTKSEAYHHLQGASGPVKAALSALARACNASIRATEEARREPPAAPTPTGFEHLDAETIQEAIHGHVSMKKPLPERDYHALREENRRRESAQNAEYRDQNPLQNGQRQADASTHGFTKSNEFGKPAPVEGGETVEQLAERWKQEALAGVRGDDHDEKAYAESLRKQE